MPYYEYYCDSCKRKDCRLLSVANMERGGQRCVACESPLRKLVSVPHLRLPSRVMSGSDDGFGNDNMSRKLAYARARAAGVSTAGKKFHPGLCRKGVPFDPLAWHSTAEEAIHKATSLGRCVEGAINATSPIRDEDYKKAEAPYRCAPDVVAPEAAKVIKEKYGGKVSRKKAHEIVEELRDVHSGNPDTEPVTTLAPK